MSPGLSRPAACALDLTVPARNVEPASDDYSRGGDWAGESVALEHRG